MTCIFTSKRYIYDDWSDAVKSINCSVVPRHDSFHCVHCINSLYAIAQCTNISIFLSVFPLVRHYCVQCRLYNAIARSFVFRVHVFLTFKWNNDNKQQLFGIPIIFVNNAYKFQLNIQMAVFCSFICTFVAHKQTAFWLFTN